jgi:hypothetical protein
VRTVRRRIRSFWVFADPHLGVSAQGDRRDPAAAAARADPRFWAFFDPVIVCYRLQRRGQPVRTIFVVEPDSPVRGLMEEYTSGINPLLERRRG